MTGPALAFSTALRRRFDAGLAHLDAVLNLLPDAMSAAGESGTVLAR